MTAPPETAPSARRDALPLWVAVLLALFFVLRVVEVVKLGHGKSVVAVSGELNDAAMSDLIQADLQTKAAFASDAKGLAGASTGASVHPDVKSLRQALKAALDLQKETANTPGAARRVMLVRFLLQHAGGTGRDALPPLSVQNHVDPLAAFSAALPTDTLPADRAAFAAEGRLWQTVFAGGRLSPRQIADVDAQIQHLPHLRWWVSPARMALYAGQGDASEAARLARDAQRAALPPLLSFGALGLVRLGLMLVGVALLIYFISRRLQKTPAADTLWPTVPDPVPDNEKKLGAGDLFAVFVVYLLTREGLSALLSGFSVGHVSVPGLLDPFLPRLKVLPPSERATLNIVLEAFVYVLSAVPPALHLWSMARRRGASLADEIGWTGRNLGVNVLYGIGGYGVASVLMIAAALLGPRLLRNAPAPSNPVIPQLVNASGFGALALLVLLASVAAPFVEELLFRGVLYRAARLKMGAWPAIVLSGLVFGFVHPVGVVEMLAIAVLGGTFAWMAETRKSLAPSILAHCLNNLTATLLLLSVVSG